MTALIDEHPHLRVECVLRELHIASSTYYGWRRAERQPCERRRRDVERAERIKEIHTESGGTYGARVLHHEADRPGRVPAFGQSLTLAAHGEMSWFRGARQ